LELVESYSASDPSIFFGVANMSARKTIVVCSCALFAQALFISPAAHSQSVASRAASVRLSPTRVWTDKWGRELPATLVSKQGDLLTFEKQDGTQARVPLKNLASTDVIYVSTLLVQPPETSTADEVKKILALPEVVAAIKKLRAENTVQQTVNEQIQVTTLQTEYYLQRYCYRGRWYQRWCSRQVPVTQMRTQSRTVEAPMITAVTIFDDPNDPSVGTALQSLRLSALPAAAGGRASHTFAASQQILPANVLGTPVESDRVLVAQSSVFSPLPDNPNVEQIIGVVVRVLENDTLLQIAVTLKQRDTASQVLSRDTAALQNAANLVAQQIVQEAQK
jgi:hypothetical protein